MREGSDCMHDCFSFGRSVSQLESNAFSCTKLFLNLLLAFLGETDIYFTISQHEVSYHFKEVATRCRKSSNFKDLGPSEVTENFLKHKVTN